MNLMSFALFGMIFLIFLAIVSNASEDSQENIQNQMFLMNCPLPAFDAQWNATNVTIVGFVVILNDTAGVDYGGDGTVFRCLITPLTPFPAFQVIMTNKPYNSENSFGIPTGWYSYTADFLGSLFQRINQLFTLIGFFVTPTNFNILGFTLDDLSGIALLFVIAMYSLCYIAIGVWLYKTISPFGGA